MLCEGAFEPHESVIKDVLLLYDPRILVLFFFFPAHMTILLSQRETIS